MEFSTRRVSHGDEDLTVPWGANPTHARTNHSSDAAGFNTR
jgi:formylmethanofuran dehydrogenase subunit B